MALQSAALHSGHAGSRWTSLSPHPRGRNHKPWATPSASQAPRPIEGYSQASVDSMKAVPNKPARQTACRPVVPLSVSESPATHSGMT